MPTFFICYVLRIIAISWFSLRRCVCWFQGRLGWSHTCCRRSGILRTSSIRFDVNTTSGGWGGFLGVFRLLFSGFRSLFCHIFDTIYTTKQAVNRAAILAGFLRWTAGHVTECAWLAWLVAWLQTTGIFWLLFCDKFIKIKKSRNFLYNCENASSCPVSVNVSGCLFLEKNG